MPIGIIGSLAVCTVLYVAVAIVLTGMSKWNTLGTAEPLADAFLVRGMKWTAGIIALGGMLDNVSVVLRSTLDHYNRGDCRILLFRRQYWRTGRPNQCGDTLCVYFGRSRNYYPALH